MNSRGFIKTTINGGIPINKPTKSNNGRDNRNRGRQMDTTRVNERIRVPKVRVVMYSGEQLGVMSTYEALAKAKEYGMDLVEVASTAVPPVCRIIDYGRYKYQQAKLQKSNKSKTTRMKEVKFRVGTSQNDYNIKMARAESFLAAGHKVRIQLQFRGRENAHQNLGLELLQGVISDLKGVANVDQAPKLAGRACMMALSPVPEAQRVRKFTAHLYEKLDDQDPELEDTEESDILNEAEEV